MSVVNITKISLITVGKAVSQILRFSDASKGVGKATLDRFFTVAVYNTFFIILIVQISLVSSADRLVVVRNIYRLP